MSTYLKALLLTAALSVAACGSAPPSATTAHHQRIECERVAPTGSRIKTHVECGDRGGYGNFKVRTWADIDKERAD